MLTEILKNMDISEFKRSTYYTLEAEIFLPC